MLFAGAASSLRTKAEAFGVELSKQFETELAVVPLVCL